ncbi:restriction endonuclease subunit S [Acinetobacter johnsonii]|uniref:restriction endonuclease subunit S n=1 Tax=Acinetobacter johnsonii TaxID=40214 RepID=UPI00196AB99F|nr:restriction endonuclease subunit S [Acinetobacter johnsonii]QSE46076.1 restriction endonuclease subunit S [Acinetobacter johnsonii]
MKLVRFGDLCKLQNGRAFKPEEWSEEGTPIVRIQNLNDETKPFNYCNFDVEKRFWIDSGDLLFSWSGTPGTSFGAFFWNRGKGFLNQHIFRVDVKEEFVDKHYLRYALNSLIIKIIDQAHGGVGLKHITKAKLEEVQIPLPPLEQQRRIAFILDQADKLRQKRQQAIEKLDQLLQATFIDMFGDPVSNPKGWEVGCIGDMLESVKYGSSDKATLEGEIPILRMNNLTYSGEMDLRDLKYITKVQADEKYLVKEGDILFNRTNSKELVGKTAVYVGPEPMAYAGYLVRGRTKENFAPEYISAFLNSPWGKEKLQSMCKSIVGMANINAKEFQSIVLPIPPENEQMHFKARVLAIREKKQLLVNQLNVFETLFKSLQNQAFNGTL